MVRLVIVPKEEENLYSLLVKKELQLRRQKQGTLHRSKGKKDEQWWFHASYNGWIRFQNCLGGTVVALVRTKSDGDEWQLLQSFVGFLNRHFRDRIISVTINFD